MERRDFAGCWPKRRWTTRWNEPSSEERRHRRKIVPHRRMNNCEKHFWSARIRDLTQARTISSGMALLAERWRPIPRSQMGKQKQPCKKFARISAPAGALHREISLHLGLSGQQAVRLLTLSRVTGLHQAAASC
jgi:hypothetical protein